MPKPCEVVSAPCLLYLQNREPLRGPLESRDQILAYLRGPLPRPPPDGIAQVAAFPLSHEWECPLIALT